ncbi:hypothetical protein J2Z64_004267 [Oceanobacillus polygoni]|uniref:Uncharacterized protein n=1 Tax=Oceanobacillus polygoni TaxID=1235259 RepID=A0A9X0YW43_9BACI|nr:hypothetical protein [Oceanobacillus polygoni]
MAVNLRKYTAKNTNQTTGNENTPTKNGSDHQKPAIGTIFKLFLASYVPASQRGSSVELSLIVSNYLLNYSLTVQLLIK